MASNLKLFLASKFNILEVFLFQSMPAVCGYLSPTLLSWCLNFSFKMETPYGDWWEFVACSLGGMPGCGSFEVTLLLLPNGCDKPASHWGGTAIRLQNLLAF